MDNENVEKPFIKYTNVLLGMNQNEFDLHKYKSVNLWLT